MRLWTLHPKYLDAKGVVALWREAPDSPEAHPIFKVVDGPMSPWERT